jgi:hypothetical protein
MDIKQRVMDDSPNSWLHKIARIVPGFKGYMDRERRRDADKLLRTHISREFSAQRDRLNRVQQSLLRARNMSAIGEVDRLSGVLQRLIDRINTATYGYTGMFDPVKIEAEDLDQLYAFDMALAGGVDQVSSAITSLDAEGEELDTAVERLSDLLDDLNERMNQRSELLTSGKRLPSDEYQQLLDRLEPLPPYDAGAGKGGDLGAPSGSTGTGSPSMGGYAPGSTPGGVTPPLSSTGMGGGSTPTPSSPGKGSSGAGEPARVSGMGAADEGVPTVNLGTGAGTGTGTGTGAALEPGLSGLTEGNQSSHPMPRDTSMSGLEGGPMPVDDTAGGGVQSASSPAGAPGAPGGDIVDGLQMGRNMEQVADVDSDGSTKRDA